MASYSFADAFGGDFITRNWETMRRVRKPVIAAVNGYALGGGCELAMMCDFIIAGDSAKFGQPEIKLGIIPGAGGTQRLPRAVGKAKAMDMALTARMMDAAEAERAGLVSRVVPAEHLELRQGSAGLCPRLCQGPRAAGRSRSGGRFQDHHLDPPVGQPAQPQPVSRRPTAASRPGQGRHPGGNPRDRVG